MANEKLVRIKNRADSTENWSKSNPTLQMGELGIAFDVFGVSTPGSPSVPKVKIGKNNSWNDGKYVIGSCVSDDNGADSFNNTNLKNTNGMGQSNYAYGQFSHAEGNGTQAGGYVIELTYTNTAGVYTADGNYKSETSLYLYKEDEYLKDKIFLGYITASSVTYDTTTKKTTFTFETKYTDTKLYFINSGITPSGSIPLGSGAHSEGFQTVAFGDAQHVEGKYNIVDYGCKYAHIVGNGDINVRSNAYTLDWDGNATFSGHVYRGCKDNYPRIELTNFSAPIKIDSASDLDNAEIGSLFYMPMVINSTSSTSIVINGDASAMVHGVKNTMSIVPIMAIMNLNIYPGAKFTYNNITYTIINNKYSIDSYGYGQLGEFIIDKPLNDTIEYESIALTNNTFTVNPGDTIMRTIAGWKKIDIEYSKASNTEVIDNLTSTDTDKALSANQGKLLNDKINNIPISTTSANGSIVIGKDNSCTSSGNNSIAHGKMTKATAQCAHAEGIGTTASGFNSHSEGGGSTASGAQSHAEGNTTKAGGNSSHSEGYYTIASSDYQHVEGKCNIEDTANKYAHIVGNGIPGATPIRSNAYTLDWSGNSWYAGTIKVGGSSYDASDAKEVATKEYVDSSVNSLSSISLKDRIYVKVFKSSDTSPFTIDIGSFDSDGGEYVEFAFGDSLYVASPIIRSVLANGAPYIKLITDTNTGVNYGRLRLSDDLTKIEYSFETTKLPDNTPIYVIIKKCTVTTDSSNLS